VPADKIGVPKATFRNCSPPRFQPPPDVLALALHRRSAGASAFLRHFAAASAGIARNGRRRSEDHGDALLRAGSLVSNLDFVESIFGNAGDPDLPENDAALDVCTGPGTPVA
jgi:hypothetical protein